jgi:hypothetical protein
MENSREENLKIILDDIYDTQDIHDMIVFALRGECRKIVDSGIYSKDTIRMAVITTCITFAYQFEVLNTPAIKDSSEWFVEFVKELIHLYESGQLKTKDME